MMKCSRYQALGAMWCALTMLLTLSACGPGDGTSDMGSAPQDMAPAPEDMAPDVDLAPDLADSGDDGGDQGDMGPDSEDMRPPYVPRFGEVVEVDLTPYLAPLEGATGGASAYEATREDQLLTGARAQGRVGDYILENEHGKFVVEGARRVMSPCPYGGNVTDAAAKLGEDGALLEDNVGELCLLANVAQTFYPERFEIVQAGSASEAAILQVTGRLEQLDFLNFGALVGEYLPSTINLPIDLDAVNPATLTLTYILRPGDHGLRVVSALRNEGQEALHMAMGHLLTGGGEGGYFNPLGTEKGFGQESLSASNLDGVMLPFLVWRGAESSYAYVPDPDPRLVAELPAAGVSLYTSGASAVLLRRESLLQTVLAKSNQFKNLPGLFHLEPGESDFISHQIFVGDGGLNTMLDYAYPTLGLEVGEVSGVVTDTDEQPVAGARVSVISASGSAINQAMTDAEGRYALRVPVGRYTIDARAPGAPSTGAKEVEVAAGGESEQDLLLFKPAHLSVTVSTPDGVATPGRVTVFCAGGACPFAPISQLEDVNSDRLPSNVAAIFPTNVSGEVQIPLPQGAYKVVVSRGMEWSLWPSNAHQSGGHTITLEAGERAALEAEIAHVVRTPGVLTGDFHIHGLTSTDSAVSQQNRVLDYMSEGVDVMVSTDHDFISDYRPAIEALGAEGQIISLIGSEITTSDTGHMNAFPLQQDPASPTFGALDWGNDVNDSLLPAQIYDWVAAFPGEQVIQVNHPEGTGTLHNLRVDTLRGTSHVDAATHRLPVQPIDPVTGDTGLWAETFTAMELMNSHSLSNFWTISRWWLTMVGRGFSPTMTATTDSHRRWANIGGVPRTLVFVGEGVDSTTTFDSDAFAHAVNSGRAIGTNGPFFTIALESERGESATLGETLDVTQGGKITGKVVIEMPEWMEVDALDLYINREDVILEPGVEVEEELPPSQSIPIVLDPQTDLEEAAVGTSTHKRWVKEVTFELELDKDSYVVVMLRAKGPNARGMHPVLPGSGVKPLAFSNPIFIDADGNGYDHPPLQQLAMMPPSPMPPSYHAHPHAHGPHGEHLPVAGEGEAAAPTELTKELLWQIIDGAQCKH